MEQKTNLNKDHDEKKFKKKKSVNWEKVEEQQKKPEVKLSPDNDKEYLEIEVINEDGKTIKEKVKYESKERKEFAKKREEKMHDEYKKAKEFLEKHKNEE